MKNRIENWELNELAAMAGEAQKALFVAGQYRPSAERLRRKECLERALARGEAEWVRQ